MPAVESKAEIHAAFLDNAKRLAETSKRLGDAAAGAEPRVWQHPPAAAGWAGSHADLEGLAAPFNRDEINDNHARVVAASGGSAGTHGDLVGLGIQLAWTGALERAYRARHASPVRRLTLAAGRRRGHGAAAGVFTGGVVGAAQDAIAAGKTRPRGGADHG